MSDLRRLAPPLLCLTLTAAACTGSGYDPSAADGSSPGASLGATPRTSGVLFVERVQNADGEEVQVGARFLRIVGVRDEALPDLVGVPTSPSGFGCTERRGDAVTPGLEAEVRLLDVGALEASAGSLSVRMTPRRFPDLWNVVSGVVYGAEGPFPDGTWSFRGGGDAASGIGPFEVSAGAPEALAGVRVDDQALPLAPDTTLSLRRSAGVSVRWQRGADPEDRVTVSFEGAGSLTCSSRDEGAFDLDAATSDRAREILRGGGTVSVHRVRTRAFNLQGIDRASLVFDMAVRARVR